MKLTDALATHLESKIDVIPKKDLPVRSKKAPSTDVFDIELFTVDKIKKYLKLREIDIEDESHGALNANTMFEKIESIYDLEDLARRPILLKMIVDTIPDLFKNNQDYFRIQRGDIEVDYKNLTPSILYLVYTEGELTREVSKGAARLGIDRDTKRKLVEDIALKMLLSSSLKIDRNSIYSIFKEMWPELDSKTLDAEMTELRTCSFLTTDDIGSIRFVHKSFYEYFAAEALLRKYISMAPIPDKTSWSKVLDIPGVSEEICYFMGDLIQVFYANSIKALHELRVCSDTSKQAISNAINVLNFGQQWVSELTSISVSKLRYLKPSPFDFVFDNCTAESVGFERAKISSLKLLRSKFVQLKISQSSINALSFRDGTIIDELQIDSSPAGEISIYASTIRSIIASPPIESISAERSSIVVAEHNLDCVKRWHLKNSLVTFDFKQPELAMEWRTSEELKSDILDEVRIDKNISLQDSRSKVITAEIHASNCYICDLDLSSIASQSKLRNCVFVNCTASSLETVLRFKSCGGFVYWVGRDEGAPARHSIIRDYPEFLGQRYYSDLSSDFVKFFKKKYPNAEIKESDKRELVEQEFLRSLSYASRIAYFYYGHSMRNVTYDTLVKLCDNMRNL